jgi:hypothetical protein
MADYKLENEQVTLWPNPKHVVGDKQPCLKGKACINGTLYEVALWAPKPGKKAYNGNIKLQTWIKDKEIKPPENIPDGPTPEPELPF